MSIQEIKPQDVDLRLAHKLSGIFYDSFYNDSISAALWGPRFNIPTPPPAGSAADYAKVRSYLKYANWVRFRDPNTRLFVLSENDEIVGFSWWFLPRKLAKPLTLWQKLESCIGSLVANVLKVVYFLGRKNPPSAATYRVFREAEDHVGYTKLQTPESELAHMSRDELAKARYSRDEYSWCQLCAVSSTCQGKGYGKKLFKHAMDNIQRFEPVFKDGSVQSQGPAKLGLFATEPGRRVYEKLGWVSIDSYTKVINGIELKMPLLVYTCE